MALDGTTSIDDLVDAAFEADGIPTPQNGAEENPFKQGAEDQEAQHKARSEIMAGAGESYGEGSVATPHSQAAKEKKEKEKANRRTADAVMASALENAMEDFEKGTGGVGFAEWLGFTRAQKENNLRTHRADDIAAAKQKFVVAGHSDDDAEQLALTQLIEETDAKAQELGVLKAESDAAIEAQQIQTNNSMGIGIAATLSKNADGELSTADFNKGLDSFIEQIQNTIGQNGMEGIKIRELIENYEKQIEKLQNSEWGDRPEIMSRIDDMQSQIDELETSFDKHTNINGFLGEIIDFVDNNREPLENCNNTEEMLVLALEDPELMEAYNLAIEGMDPDERKKAFFELTEKLGIPLSEAEKAFTMQTVHVESFSGTLNTIQNSIEDAYQWSMGFFSQSVEDIASQDQNIITEQQAQIDALKAERDIFMGKIDAMDNNGALMNHYFKNIEKLDVKITEMETQLDDYKTAIAELEAAEQNLADLDKQLEQTEATINGLYTGGMSTAPNLTNSEPSLVERFSNPAVSPQISTAGDAPNMSKIDPQTLKIRSAEFQANILEIEQADAAAALAKAAAIKDRAEAEITGDDADTTEPAPAPDPAQLALDNNIEKINGLFSSGITMPEEDFIAWAKENGIAIPEGQENRFTDMVIEKLADNGVSRINPIAPRIDTPDAPNSTLSASRAGPPSNPGLFNAAADPVQPTPEAEVALDLTPKHDATIHMGANG